MNSPHQVARKLGIAVLILAVWLLAGPTYAALINAGGQVWALNPNGPARNFYAVQNASDGNTGTTWVTEAGGDYFASYPNGQPVLLFDLGADVTMNGLGFFNYSTSNANNTRALSLRFATSAEGPLGMSKSIAYQASYTTAYGGPAIQENLPFAQPVTARYVQMTVTDNYYGVNVPPVYPGGDRVGFADVQFDVPAPPAFRAPVTLARPTANVTDPGSNVSVIIDGTSGTQWYSVASGADYFGTGGTAPVLVIDLGSQRTINGLNFWNYSITGNRTKDFSLRFATESEGPGAFGATIAYNPSFTAANLAQTQQQSMNFSQPVSARYVQMTIASNYVAAGGGGDRVGFSEIAFRDAAAPLGYTTVVRPVSAASSTAATDFYPVANLIDGNAATTWVTVGEGDYYTNRFTPILTFDLGRDYGLTGLRFQNYPVGGNAAKDFALAFATEADGPNGFGTSVNYFPVFHAAVDPNLVQNFSFSQMVGARYVRMLVLDNYAGWGYAGGDRAGFAEFALLAVPEPSTWILAAVGLLGLGLSARRRVRRR